LGLRWIKCAERTPWQRGRMNAQSFDIDLVQRDGYRFEIDFRAPGVAPLLTDASPPLGTGAGPDSEALLVAAVANCLAASLCFALRKFGNRPQPLRARGRTSLVRNAQGRPRIGRIDVEIELGDPAAGLRLLERALALYEDFCVVTQSVRAGIQVDVRVVDSEGLVLQGAAVESAADKSST
jgi:organic hydroperoxide reductase OsmC/OhrA